MVGRIESVWAREVFDSRGKPTVEVEVRCAGGMGRAIVPSGASTGRHEARELRDGGPRLRGLGVRRAVQNVNEVLGPAVRGVDAADQREVDRLLLRTDGSPDKSRLGANGVLGVSLAAAHAAAGARGEPLFQHIHRLWEDVRRGAKHAEELEGEPLETEREGWGSRVTLPLPMVNMISGGLHAGRKLDVQDFLMVPVGAATYSQALEWVVAVYWELGEVLRSEGFEGTLVGDEGGYGPALGDNTRALELLVIAFERAGLRPGQDAAIAVDVAASHFFDGAVYRLSAEGGAGLSASALIDRYTEWVNGFPIVSLEDPLAEDDWDGWREITARLAERVQIVGDDLFVTNRERLRLGIERGVANSVLVKVNQIGSVWETLECLRVAHEEGYRPVISARSGETEDSTIADLAVGVGAGQIKIGSVARSERLAKYNQLLRIEEQLGSGQFAGRRAISPSLKKARGLSGE